MTEQYDIGMREDFDNMTEDLGREVTIYTREEVLTYEGQSGEDSNNKDYGTKEVAFIPPIISITSSDTDIFIFLSLEIPDAIFLTNLKSVLLHCRTISEPRFTALSAIKLFNNFHATLRPVS